jgi:hypothetical protein
MTGKIEPTACDGRLPKANSNTQLGQISPPPPQSQARNDVYAEAIRDGAVRALRRRADRQARIAQAETTTAERGAPVMSGEGRIAQRLAEAFSELADELDGAPR